MRQSTAAVGLALFLAGVAGTAIFVLPAILPLAKAIPATEVVMGEGTQLSLQKALVGPLRMTGKKFTWEVVVQSWAPADRATLTWSETFERETMESIQAREAAERATGVGAETQIPEPVYESIVRVGSLQTDALDDGDRVFLPSEWPEEAVDFSGKSNSLIWLSRAHYDELVTTRHTHLEIGSLDASLQDAANVLDAVKDLVGKFQAEAPAPSDIDVTEIVADPEWGSHTFMYNGQKVKVQTIEAENKFASYQILANPDNPLILEVNLKAWAYGTEALGTISEDLQIAGYSITQITTNENHPE